jgi:hypothetical protein
LRLPTDVADVESLRADIRELERRARWFGLKVEEQAA